MSQFDFGTIDPNTKSGSVLATDLNTWRNALHSLHAGTSRPTYAVQGLLWMDTTNDPLWDLKLYDGSEDITLGEVNSTTNVFTPSNTGLISGSIGDFSGKLGVVRPVLSKNSGYLTTAADRHKMIDFTASATLLMEPVATLGNGWEVLVRANGADITIDPDSTETINGALTYALKDGQTVLLICDGTQIFAIPLFSNGGWSVVEEDSDITGASYDVTDLGDYQELLLVFKDLSPSADNNELRIRFSDDNGTTFETTGYVGRGESDFGIVINQNAFDASSAWSGFIRIYKPGSTNKQVCFDGVLGLSSIANIAQTFGFFDNGNAVDALQLYLETGTIDGSSQLSVYGR